MKLMFLTILLAAAFLGGYYFGHLPGSPDIFAKAAVAYRNAVELKDTAVRFFEEQKKSANGGDLALNVEGQTVRVEPHRQ